MLDQSGNVRARVKYYSQCLQSCPGASCFSSLTSWLLFHHSNIGQVAVRTGSWNSQPGRFCLRASLCISRSNNSSSHVLHSNTGDGDIGFHCKHQTTLHAMLMSYLSIYMNIANTAYIRGCVCGLYQKSLLSES